MSVAMTQSDQSTARLHYGWVIVIAAMLGLSIGVQSVVNYTLGLFFSPLRAEFGWSLQQASIAFLIMSHAIVIVSPFAGRMIDRKSGRWLIAASTALAGMGFVSLYFLTNSLVQFYVTFAFIGMLGYFTTPMAYSKLISRWFEKRLGLALGLMASGVGVGSAFLPAIAVTLIDSYGWRTAYAGMGLLMIGIAPVLAILLRDHPSQKNMTVDGGVINPELSTAAPSNDTPFAETGMTAKQALSGRLFWLLLIAFTLISFGFAAMIVPMASLLSYHGLTTAQIGIALGAMGVANFVSRLVFGWLLDHFDAIYLAMCVWVPAAFCILLLGQIQPQWLLMTIPVIIGIGLGAEIDLLAYLTRRYFGLRSMGLLYSILFSAFILSGAWGTVLISRLLDMNASNTVVQGLFAVIMSGCAVLLWVRRVGRHTA